MYIRHDYATVLCKSTFLSVYVSVIIDGFGEFGENICYAGQYIITEQKASYKRNMTYALRYGCVALRCGLREASSQRRDSHASVIWICIHTVNLAYFWSYFCTRLQFNRVIDIIYSLIVVVCIPK